MIKPFDPGCQAKSPSFRKSSAQIPAHGQSLSFRPPAPYILPGVKQPEEQGEEKKFAEIRSIFLTSPLTSDES